MAVYKIADINFFIEPKYEYTVNLLKDYLCDEVHDEIIRVSDEEILFENKDSKQGFDESYLESLAIYRKIAEKIISYDAVLFHCSALSLNGKAYLFTAPSGTGKSTHARLWREVFGDKVTMINDDKPILKFEENKLTVYGTPYDGKHLLSTNTSSEVRAIFILERAEENSAEKLPFPKAYPTLISQTYCPENENKLKKTLELLERMKDIPIFELRCNISHDAVNIAYEAVNENQKT